MRTRPARGALYSLAVRRLTIKLVRHGESEANLGLVQYHECGDSRVALSALGHEQARRAGRRIGAQFILPAHLYCSPYTRTRATLASLLEGSGVSPAGLRVYEDPRIREVEHGYCDAASEQVREAQRIHGRFFYRFQGGESPADCYDRVSSFLESMMRQVERRRTEHVLIVSHGLSIRCFVMRFLHLTVEQFEEIWNPNNCDVVTISNNPAHLNGPPVFVSGNWGVDGLSIEK